MPSRLQNRPLAACKGEALGNCFACQGVCVVAREREGVCLAHVGKHDNSLILARSFECEMMRSALQKAEVSVRKHGVLTTQLSKCAVVSEQVGVLSAPREGSAAEGCGFAPDFGKFATQYSAPLSQLR